MNGIVRLTGQSIFAETFALFCAAIFLGLPVNFASAEDFSDLHSLRPRGEAFEYMVQSVGIDAAILGAGIENGPKSLSSEPKSNSNKLDNFVKAVGLDVSKLADELNSAPADSSFGHLPQFIFCSVHQRYESMQSFGRLPSQYKLSFDPLGVEQ